MPVTEFGGSWGYNPRSCLAVHPAYGTPDDLRALVDRAAALGVAVLADICLNHGAARLNALWNWDGYGPDGCGGIYFDRGGGDTPWGKKFAFERAEVQVMGRGRGERVGRCLEAGLSRGCWPHPQGGSVTVGGGGGHDPG